MTRCLNCGAERDVDQCEACGLSSTAAEMSLRQKLLNRTAIFLVGAIAFVAASERYPALELDGILIFIGILFFLTLGLAVWVEGRRFGEWRSGTDKTHLLWLDSATVAAGDSVASERITRPLSHTHRTSARDWEIFHAGTDGESPTHRHILA